MTNGGVAGELANGVLSGGGDQLLVAWQARILVVEDDRDIAGLLGRELRALGHTVDTVRLAEDALLATSSTDYALLIVDLGLPDRDGLGLVREMRRRSIEAPILMLTARHKVEDKVIGLASGADDYLVKPFAVPELRARVAALLRRPSRLKGNRLAVANLIVDRDLLEALVDGVSLPLARKQFQLLELLVRRKNHMTPKRMIEEALYGFNDEVSANSIEAQIYKLRIALRATGAAAAIETRRGIGYRLVELGPGASNRSGSRHGRSADIALLDPDGAFSARLAQDREAIVEHANGIWTLPLGARDRRLAEIEGIAHRLAGAAGTFGHGDIGAAALELERSVAMQREDDELSRQRTGIEQSLVKLVRALDFCLEKTA